LFAHILLLQMYRKIACSEHVLDYSYRFNISKEQWSNEVEVLTDGWIVLMHRAHVWLCNQMTISYHSSQISLVPTLLRSRIHSSNNYRDFYLSTLWARF
jgi:hypothetical protein